jgi:adenosylhomocysteinase
MDGYEVLPMETAAEIGDVFCTETGDKNVIARQHMERMKDGAILSNSGNVYVEIEIAALRDLAVETREARASPTSSRSPTGAGSTSSARDAW